MEIDDIDAFCERIRNFVFNRIKHTIAKMLNVDVETLDEPDAYISQKETLMIVQENISKFGNASQKSVTKICEDINKRVFSNILNKLSIDGYLECAWSDADDSFVFKVSEKGLEKGMSIPKIFRS